MQEGSVLAFRGYVLVQGVKSKERSMSVIAVVCAEGVWGCPGLAAGERQARTVKDSENSLNSGGWRACCKVIEGGN